MFLLALTLSVVICVVIVANPNKSSISPGAFTLAESGPSVVAETPRGRGHGRATQATVARHAGVTTMTVSRYLREPQRVAGVTAERTAAALALTGHTPNKHAGMLASGRSSMVAAIIPNIATATFAETVQGLSDLLQPRGLELLLASTNYSLEREEEQIRAVLGWSPSALVVTGRRHTDAALAMMRQAQADGVPVLEMWDHDPLDRSFVQVGFSHEAVGAMMAGHMLQQGHRDLAYVDSGVREDYRAHLRARAFVAAITAAGASVRVFDAPRIDPMAAGRAAFSEMQQAGLPGAVAFASDNFAAGAYLGALEARIDVPGDLAMLGFGDFPISRQLPGGISTVSVSPLAIGKACAQHLLASWAALAEGRAPSRRHRVVVPRIVARRSSQGGGGVSPP